MHAASRILAFVLLGAIAAAGCGSAHQDVRVHREVAALGAWTRFEPAPVRLAADIDLGEETREAFDLAFRDALGAEGLLATVGVGRDVLEAVPTVVAWRIDGGVDQRFLTTEGVAELVVEVVLRNGAGKEMGRLRAVEKTEIRGLLPKVASPNLLEGTAEALAEQMAAAVER